MDLENIYKEIKAIDLPEKDKEAFIRLIKIKTDSDMDKVLHAIGALKNELNTFDHKLETSIGSLKESILSNRTETNANIGSLNSKIDNMKWFIGAIVAIAVGLAKIFKMF